MSTDEKLPIEWTPVPRQTPVTPAEPRQRPVRGDRPCRPHPLHSLPDRVLPTPDADVDVAPAVTGAAGADCQATAAVTPQRDNPTATTRLTAAIAARHGIVLHKQDTVQTLFALDVEELAALVAAGVLLEVSLGAGLTRYALAAEVPATALDERGAA